MKVAYGKGSRPTSYRCVRKRQDRASPVCQNLGARRLEQTLERLVLEALEPLGLEAMIEAAQGHAEAAEAERRHWRQRVERGEYEVSLARRQYDAIDPENRLVARELERRFEKALQDLEAMRQDAEAHIAQLPDALSPEEETRLVELARDLPSLWLAPTTRPQDRTRVVRCLIDQVVVTVPEQGAQIKADVHWYGGEISTLEVPRGRTGQHRHVAEPELIELVRRLARDFSDVQVARILHRKRIQTPKGLPYVAHRVANLRKTHGIAPGPRVPKSGDHIYTAQHAAERLGVNGSTVIRWVEAGLLKGAQVTPGAPWRIQVSEEDVRRLTTADTPKDWLTLKAAAAALGVSQQTVLQRLKSGQLEGIRVQTGRRTAWRIRLLSTSYDNQPTLFEPSVCEV
jgi:transposase